MGKKGLEVSKFTIGGGSWGWVMLTQVRNDHNTVPRGWQSTCAPWRLTQQESCLLADMAVGRILKELEVFGRWAWWGERKEGRDDSSGHSISSGQNDISKGTEAEKPGNCFGPCLPLLLIHNEWSMKTDNKHFKNYIEIWWSNFISVQTRNNKLNWSLYVSFVFSLSHCYFSYYILQQYWSVIDWKF